MEVILKRYIKGLGDQDEVVSVKPGYGRNYLIPQGYAVLATESAKKQMAESTRQASHRQEQLKDAAVQMGEKLQAAEVTVETLAGQDGKLFGSVTALMVENQLRESGYEINRKQINLDQNMRSVGEYEFIVSLHKEVKVPVKLHIVAKNQ